jgi:hypothetical protein
MPDEKVSMKSKMDGVRYEDTGEDIVIRFDTEERLNAHELNLVWEEFMFWTRSIPRQKNSKSGPASAQPCPHTTGDFVLQLFTRTARN